MHCVCLCACCSPFRLLCVFFSRSLLVPVVFVLSVVFNDSKLSLLLDEFSFRVVYAFDKPVSVRAANVRSVCVKHRTVFFPFFEFDTRHFSSS